MPETAVQQDITLDDCVFGQHEDGIRMLLPKRIDLKGITPESDPSFCDHNHYRNRFGDLYLACDYVARFSSSVPMDLTGDELKTLRLGEFDYQYEFESVWCWYSYHGELFLLADLGTKVAEILAGKSSSAEIAQTILTDDTLAARHLKHYLQTFLNWVNEFARTNGPEHFYRPEGVKLFECFS